MAKPPIKTVYLTEYITTAIQRGDYLHKLFPSERALSEETGMSMTTVRKAIAQCIESGILTRNATSRQPEIHPDYLHDSFQKHVAVILPPPTQSSAEWFRNIETVCAKKQYSLITVTYHNGEDPQIIKHLTGPYDAIFFFPPSNPSPLLLQQMKSCANRLILFFHDYTNFNIATLCDPPRSFTKQALQYLYDKGCRTVTCVHAAGSPNRMLNNQIEDWKTFLRNEKCTGELIQCGTRPAAPHYHLARNGVRTFLKNAPRLPDAFLCTTGLAAVGVVRALADCSLRAGLDVKILALSSNPILKDMTPSITSMEPPAKDTMIEQALQTPHPLHIEAENPQLFIGESTEIGLRCPT